MGIEPKGAIAPFAIATLGTGGPAQLQPWGHVGVDRHPIDFGVERVIEGGVHVLIEHRRPHKAWIEGEHPSFQRQFPQASLALNGRLRKPQASRMGRVLQGVGGSDRVVELGIAAKQHQLQVGPPVVAFVPLVSWLGQATAERGPQGELLHPAGALLGSAARVGQGLGLQVEVKVDPARNIQQPVKAGGIGLGLDGRGESTGSQHQKEPEQGNQQSAGTQHDWHPFEAFRTGSLAWGASTGGQYCWMQRR